MLRNTGCKIFFQRLFVAIRHVVGFTRSLHPSLLGQHETPELKRVPIPSKVPDLPRGPKDWRAALSLNKLGAARRSAPHKRQSVSVRSNSRFVGRRQRTTCRAVSVPSQVSTREAPFSVTEATSLKLQLEEATLSLVRHESHHAGVVQSARTGKDHSATRWCAKIASVLGLGAIESGPVPSRALPAMICHGSTTCSPPCSIKYTPEKHENLRKCDVK